MNNRIVRDKKKEKELKNNKIIREKKEKESRELDQRLKDSFPASDSTAEY